MSKTLDEWMGMAAGDGFDEALAGVSQRLVEDLTAEDMRSVEAIGFYGGDAVDYISLGQRKKGLGMLKLIAHLEVRHPQLDDVVERARLTLKEMGEQTPEPRGLGIKAEYTPEEERLLEQTQDVLSQIMEADPETREMLRERGIELLRELIARDISADQAKRMLLALGETPD